MKHIPLTRGKFAIVDDEDYYILSRVKWNCDRARGRFYAIMSQKRNGKWVRMHNVILWKPSHLFVDHINGDGLDNRRSNLRVVTHQQNMWNRKVNKNNKSGYTGVIWNAYKKKWAAYARVDGKMTEFGLFDTKEEAAKAREETMKLLRPMP